MIQKKQIRVCQVLHGIVGGGSEQVVPFISIIVPVNNASASLKKCVDSLTGQSYPNIEIILVNNGSSDNSLELCKELAAGDNRIIVDDLAEKGVSAARNRGIELATGGFVTFVDADDWIDSNVCEMFVNSNAKCNCDLFCYSAQYHKRKKIIKSFLFAENIQQLSETQKEELQIKVFAPNAPYFEYKTNTRFAGSVWGKFYKRDILLKNNLRFARETIVSEDVLFNTLALDCFHRIGYTRDCFYHYMQQNDSAQNRYRPNSDKYFSFIISKIQEWIQSTDKNQHFIDAANSLFAHYLFGILKEDLCHKDNPHQIADRKHMLKCVLSNNVFSELLENFRMDYFSLPERVLIELLRHQKIGIIFFLLKFIK